VLEGADSGQLGVEITHLGYHYERCEHSSGASNELAFLLDRVPGRPLMVAVAAGSGRAVSEFGASLTVGGNIVGQTRILTTAIALETGRGEFALAIALGIILLKLALVVNTALGLPSASNSARL
jgi:ABC-type tungstate transport system substrate-binding protein